MHSASKTYSYVAPKAKVIEFNARGAFLTLSQNTGNYRNEKMDVNPSGFGEDFWD